MPIYDQGPDTVEIYPEIESFDELGNPQRVPSSTPVTITCNLQSMRPSEWNLIGSTEDNREGQQSTEMLQFITRAKNVPAGPWGIVRTRDRVWDIVGEPQRASRMGHVKVILRSRRPRPAPGEVIQTASDGEYGWV